MCDNGFPIKDFGNDDCCSYYLLGLVLPISNKQIMSFVGLLKNNSPEHRDNRGKSHTLVSALIVMEREIVEIAKQKTTFDTSYYVSNSAIESSSIKALTKELAGAICCYWGVESNNWIRGVTLIKSYKNKNKNKTKQPSAGHGFAAWSCN